MRGDDFWKAIPITNTILLVVLGMMVFKANQDPWLVVYDRASDFAKTVKLNRKENAEVLNRIALTRAVRLALAAYPFDGELPGNELNDAIDSSFAKAAAALVRETNQQWNTGETGQVRPECFLNEKSFQFATRRGRIVYRAVYQRFDSQGREKKFLVQGQAVPATMVSDNPLGVFFEKFSIEEI